MDIIVALKRVPDAASRIEIDKGGGIVNDGISWITNPHDEFALEEALRIKERSGGRVIALNACDEGGEDVLKKALALGADSAICVKDPRIKGLDSIAVSRILAAAASRFHFDLIICGHQAADDSTAIAGPVISSLLGIPIVSSVRRLDVFPAGMKATALRELDAGSESVEARLPAVFTAQKGLNEPRLPSLSGIMRAKREAVEYIGLDALGLNPEALREKLLEREGLSYPVSARKAVILKGDIAFQVKEAARFLREEVRII